VTTRRRPAISWPILISNAIGIGAGCCAGVALIAWGYLAAINPMPEHTLLVREGYHLRQWHMPAPVTVCPDGRIYPMSNYRSPCAGYTPWVTP
jgi:hypothetical protein